MPTTSSNIAHLAATGQQAGDEPGDEQTPDEQAIRALMQTWQCASQAGDLDTVMSLMADDVVFLIPGREPMDKAGFYAASTPAPGQTRPTISSTFIIKDLHVSGDLASQWAQLDVTVTPATAAPIERTGPTLTVFRRIDGRWLLWRDANLLVGR